jgi:hypothetical protein
LRSKLQSHSGQSLRGLLIHTHISFGPGVHLCHVPRHLHNAKAYFRRNFTVAVSNLSKSYLRSESLRGRDAHWERFLVTNGHSHWTLHRGWSILGFPVVPETIILSSIRPYVYFV